MEPERRVDATFGRPLPTVNWAASRRPELRRWKFYGLANSLLDLRGAARLILLPAGPPGWAHQPQGTSPFLYFHTSGHQRAQSGDESAGLRLERYFAVFAALLLILVQAVQCLLRSGSTRAAIQDSCGYAIQWGNGFFLKGVYESVLDIDSNLSRQGSPGFRRNRIRLELGNACTVRAFDRLPSPSVSQVLNGNRPRLLTLFVRTGNFLLRRAAIDNLGWGH